MKEQTRAFLRGESLARQPAPAALSSLRLLDGLDSRAALPGLVEALDHSDEDVRHAAGRLLSRSTAREEPAAAREPTVTVRVSRL